jgi:hypothetical protein
LKWLSKVIVLFSSGGGMYKKKGARYRWLTPVILATQEADFRRIMV